jgi:hypothetical protein
MAQAAAHKEIERKRRDILASEEDEYIELRVRGP